jgi:hypothetical protein
MEQLRSPLRRLHRFRDYVKIGWSRRIGERLRELEYGLPEPLIIHTISIGGTVRDERDLHQRFRRLRIKNEWFRSASPLSEFIEARKRWLTSRWRASDPDFNEWDTLLTELRDSAA